MNILDSIIGFFSPEAAYNRTIYREWLRSASNYDAGEIDESILIDTEEAYETARRIVHEEGIFVGMSSGAAMLAALKVAEKIKTGTIVVIFPDRGEKYLSTDLFKV